MATDESDPNAEDPAGPAGPGPATGQPDTVKVLEEELSVGTEKVETGRVRVSIATHEREETVDVPLTAQRVEVERVAIGREVEAIPPRRQEGDTTILPVVEEVVVVSRKLVLKEEIRLKAVSSTEQYRERVVLHRQEAVVERTPAQETPPTQTQR